jgi:hypothetical protein
MALSWPQKRTARRVASKERLGLGNVKAIAGIRFGNRHVARIVPPLQGRAPAASVRSRHSHLVCDAYSWSMIPRVEPEGMVFRKPAFTRIKSGASFFGIML